jgi:hypothetical protein
MEDIVVDTFELRTIIDDEALLCVKDFLRCHQTDQTCCHSIA